MEIIFWCGTKFLVWPKTFGTVKKFLGPVEGRGNNKWFILPFKQRNMFPWRWRFKITYGELKKSCRLLKISRQEGPGSKIKCKIRKITDFIKFAVLILPWEIRPQGLDFGGSTASILSSNEANLRPQLWICPKFSKSLDRNCF